MRGDKRIRITVALGVVAAAALALPAVSSAALLQPNITTDENTANGDCSLREAITAAQGIGSYNGCPPLGVPLNDDADLIVLQSGQTYTLGDNGLTGQDDTNGVGDLDVNADVFDQTLTIQTSGAAPATIDATGAGDRIFDLDPSGVTVTPLVQVNLDNLILTGGSSTSGGGGAIRAGSGALSVIGSRIHGNSATGAGGAIRWTSSGSGSFTDTSIDGNTSAIGGGIFQDLGSLTLTRSTISGNSTTDATGDGGGLFMSFNTSTATLVNSTLSGNQSTASGGGAYLSNPGATLNLRNATVAGNTADSDNTDPGGGGGDGGGIFREPGTAVVSSRNSIIGDNLDVSGGAPDCSAPITSTGHNLVENTTGCTGVTGTGDVTGGDPMLGSLALNGGTTQSRELFGPLSPAIDAGDPGTPGSGGTTCELNDQRGLGRYGPCDIGAYELQEATPVLAGVGNKTVQAGSNLSFNLAATDPNPADALTFSGTGLPAGATVSPSGAFSWTPGAADVGSHPNVTLSVTDSLLSDDEAITIAVTAVPPSPPGTTPKKCKKGQKLKRGKCVKKKRKKRK